MATQDRNQDAVSLIRRFGLRRIMDEGVEGCRVLIVGVRLVSIKRQSVIAAITRMQLCGEI